MEVQFEPISHTYYIGEERLPSVTQVMKPLESYYRASDKTLERAAARGTLVHEWTERWDREDDLDPEDFPEEIRGYIVAWLHFRADFGFAPTHIEHRLYHPRLMYAGTIDRVGLIRDQVSILDIKTSAKLGPAVGVQLAAYQRAYEATTNEEVPGRFAVQLADDGTYRVVEYTNPLDWEAFRGCLALHKWVETHRVNVAMADVRPRIDAYQSDVSAWTQIRTEGQRSK